MAENQWNDEFNDPAQGPGKPARDQWDSVPQAKPGMSGGMKAFLIIAAVLGACCLLCCGIGGYFIYSVGRGIKTSQVPAEVNAAKDQIAAISIPAGFAPVQMVSMDNFMMLMTTVEYKNPPVHGEISIAE